MNEPTKPKDGGPAFPCPAGHAIVERYQPGVGEYTSTVEVCQSGMSLRDYFAGQAMLAWSRARVEQTVDDLTREDMAAECYHDADAMLRAREMRMIP